MRRRQQVNLEDIGPRFSEDGYYQGPVGSWPLDPEDVMLNSELSNNLYEAIQSLPFEYRMPMVLRDIEGYPIKQISSLLGLKEATAKTRVHRAGYSCEKNWPTISRERHETLLELQRVCGLAARLP